MIGDKYCDFFKNSSNIINLYVEQLIWFCKYRPCENDKNV